MNAFHLRDELVEDYARYTKSFIKIRDERIKRTVDTALEEGTLWPDPLLQLNPSFEPGGSIDELVDEKILHDECRRIFRMGKDESDHTGKPLLFHRHQREAILRAKKDRSYVLTSGTGSGKSLTYIVPIVDHVLRRGTGRGVQAIVVYPMNALANSQDEELRKFLQHGYPEGKPPVTWRKYTGQEKGDEREEIRANPPDILLTNYMMLELMLTRVDDRELVRAAQDLKFLVFDELHTYRGRQGADVAMLIRRCRSAFGGHDMICVGTSATMASGGNSEDQEREVAKVAETLFGTSITTDQVIGEFLERKTVEVSSKDPAIREALTRAVKDRMAPPETYEAFIEHPLSSWIETTFGVLQEEGTKRLIRRKPRPIQEPEGAATDLSKITGVDVAQCEEVLRAFLLQGSKLFPSSGRPYPAFAFRLHQFFTRADTVWTTMEPEDVRHPEMSKQVSKPGEPDKLLYPLVFCRHCGAEYYRVTWRKIQQEDDRLFPREDRSQPEDPHAGDAYLYLSNGAPWPKDPSELLNRLPDFMKEEQADGSLKLRKENKDDLPLHVNVTPDGRIVPDGHGQTAAVIMDNFLFCLAPNCGVAYNKNQRSERAKLNTLGVDNRSTATTVLAIRSLIELQSDRDLEKRARKLLSFTDNRQDASLQAGHFNDFAQVALLRSALYKAALARKDEGIDHAALAQVVFDEMKLPFEEFAADPEVRGIARQETVNALLRVFNYFLYRDLKSGWRVTAPNLEDCGLLRFDYAGLEGGDGLLGEDPIWTEGIKNSDGVLTPVPQGLAGCSTDERREVIRTLLDIMRRGLAVKNDALDPLKQQHLVESTKPRLQEGTVWYLEDARDLEKSKVAYARPRRQGDQLTLNISSYGSYGRYLRRLLQPFVPKGQPFNRPLIDEHIQFLFLALKRYGIIEQVRDGEAPGYQINPNSLRWLVGDGVVRPTDRTRMLSLGETPPEANQYFVECYKRFVDLNCVLEAREHTAQVSPEDREEREQQFREAELPLLFCSPTMELGVDIAQLNLVNMRNVPPTPANYAQRSGRAGRSGQPALVYTYCAGRSPHDQYYFRRPEAMVAGAVAPPRIDLTNRDLVRSHVHAVWMEVAKPDLGKTLNTVLEIVPDNGKIRIPVKDAVVQLLRDPAKRASALLKAEALLKSIGQETLSRTSWYHDKWTEEVLKQIERMFDASCQRWRMLYRSAIRQRDLNHRIIIDLTRPDHEKQMAVRLRQQAESQIRLLTEAEGVFEGDFYSYRYFASEGFLPGYSFPRLPISAFIPARRRRGMNRDEFVSRPRFLAISEFAPRALIYHEGARYQVNKVNLDYGTDDVEATHALNTMTMKRCKRCGYAHIAEGLNMAEMCDNCGDALDQESLLEDLVQLQNVSLRLTKRITCDEEERQRFGYKVISCYRFMAEDGRRDRRDAHVFVDNALRLSLSYGNSASIYRINTGWRNQKKTEPPGFLINTETGIWARNKAEKEDNDDPLADGRQQRVLPFVMDTKNVLVMRFEPAPSVEVMAGLQAAFKEAILRAYQLEPRELACEPMPSASARQELLLYEASEGGAGVLRLLVEDPMAIPMLARHALDVCHFDPVTLKEKHGTKCGKACYECLLDYNNQPDHEFLDRHKIRQLLIELMGATVRPAGGTGSREERIEALRKRCDSKLEQRWLKMVDEMLLNPPSDAQFLIQSCSTKPDFYYKDLHAAIYIDGPPHDAPDQLKKDEAIDACLMDRGFLVVRFHHQADWNEVFARHPDIFGKGTSANAEETELAVVTVRFDKPDKSPFTPTEQDLCRKESEAALNAVLATASLPEGVRVEVRYHGDGTSSYWVEFTTVVVSTLTAAPTLLHLIGQAFGSAAQFTLNLSARLSLTGEWFNTAAWRLSPQDPNGSEVRRPGCFGDREQQDRRTKRCRDCGFLGECTELIQTN